jgi:hypothetical protein
MHIGHRTAAGTPFVSTNEVVFCTSTDLPGKEVRLPVSWLAYHSDSMEVPTVEAYDLMFVNIMSYFNESLQAFYADQGNGVMFVEVAALLTDVGHNEGIPEERFNILMTLDNFVLTFAPGSEVPNEAEAFDVVKGLITIDYILDVVRTITGTPFESVTEVFFQAKTDDTTAAPDPDPSPTSAPAVGLDVPFEGGTKGAKQHKNNPQVAKEFGAKGGGNGGGGGERQPQQEANKDGGGEQAKGAKPKGSGGGGGGRTKGEKNKK